MSTWSARDAGRSEREWLLATPWADLDTVDVGAFADQWQRLLVVSSHPDDETLGVGAFMAEAAGVGMAVEVLLVTDGEASHPRAPHLTREALAAVRRDELTAALGHLGAGIAVTRCGLPDGGVAAGGSALEEALVAYLTGDGGENGDGAQTLVLAPWTHDGHADHDATGRLTAEVCRRLGVACAHYPVWLWHWSDPGDMPWGDAVLVTPSPSALHAKGAALEAFRSQVDTFGLPQGCPPVLSDAVRARAERPVETLIDPDAVLPRRRDAGLVPAERFDAMFDAGDDPWGFEERWYEQRKRAIVEALLPHRDLGRVLDLGCSTGALAAALAPRSEGIVAVDASARALEVARRRPASGIEWIHGALPEVLAELTGPFDTVIVSEVGYFLDGRVLAEVLSACDRMLTPDGVVVSVNWQHPTRDIPLDGVIVTQATGHLWPVFARYEDADVTVLVSRPGGES